MIGDILKISLNNLEVIAEDSPHHVRILLYDTLDKFLALGEEDQYKALGFLRDALRHRMDKIETKQVRRIIR